MMKMKVCDVSGRVLPSVTTRWRQRVQDGGPDRKFDESSKYHIMTANPGF